MGIASKDNKNNNLDDIIGNENNDSKTMTIEVNHEESLMLQALSMNNLILSMCDNNNLLNSNYYEDELNILNSSILTRNILQQSSLANPATVTMLLFNILLHSKKLWHDSKNNFYNRNNINDAIRNIVLSEETRLTEYKENDGIDYITMIYYCVTSKVFDENMIARIDFSSIKDEITKEEKSIVKFYYDIHGFDNTYFTVESSNIIPIINQISSLILSYFNNKHKELVKEYSDISKLN